MIAALAGSVVGGVVGETAAEAVRGITGALIGMGIPEHEARRYEERINGGIDSRASFDFDFKLQTGDCREDAR
jgi:hypothetical protein